MNGIHDMGGMQCFGPIAVEPPDSPPFHSEWERRMFALNFALGGLGLWTLDMARAEMEATPPDQYMLGDDYFRRWALRLERFALKFDLVKEDEFAAGRSLRPPREGLKPALAADIVPELAAKGKSTARALSQAALFKMGDFVRARDLNPEHHTRQPRYIRGRTGKIVGVYGGHVFPDTNSVGREDPQWLYAVSFSGRSLWGPDADPKLEVVVDCWEPYLEAAR